MDFLAELAKVDTERFADAHERALAFLMQVVSDETVSPQFFDDIDDEYPAVTSIFKVVAGLEETVTDPDDSDEIIAETFAFSGAASLFALIEYYHPGTLTLTEV